MSRVNIIASTIIHTNAKRVQALLSHFAKGGLGMETLDIHKKYLHPKGSKHCSYLYIKGCHYGKPQHIIPYKFISKKFPRLLAKCEIIANALLI